MKNINLKRKSFTLLEVLVATTIFIIIMVIFITVLWAILRPRAKTQTLSALQQASQAAMDTMVDDILHANVNNPAKYVNFALTDVAGNPLSCVNFCSGNRVTALTDLYNDGVVTKRAFEITDTSLNPIAGTTCPAGQTCRLVERETNAAGGSPTPHELLPPEVDITKLEFNGYFWSNSPSNSRLIAPYMNITISFKSHFTDAASSGVLTIRTTIRPMETDNGRIVESLSY